MPSWAAAFLADELPLVSGEVTTSAKVFGVEGGSVDIPSPLGDSLSLEGGT